MEDFYEYLNQSVVEARKMKRGQYNVLRGWVLPENESGDDLGWLVVNKSVSKRNVDGYEGYVSWLPEEVFEEIYADNAGSIPASRSKIPKGKKMEDFYEYLNQSVVEARKMTRGQYNVLRGWVLPENESGDDLGWLVVNKSVSKRNVDGYEGYVSWLPEEVFEEIYADNAGSIPASRSKIPKGKKMEDFYEYLNQSVVEARKMTRGQYNVLRGWVLPENESGDDLGWLVVNKSVSKRNVDGYEGYVSWLPEEVFEEIYADNAGSIPASRSKIPKGKKMEDFYEYLNQSVVEARKMKRGQYNVLRGWVLPENESDDDLGWLVVNKSVSKRNVDGYEGYVSWLPEEVFEEIYEEIQPVVVVE